MKVYRKCVHCQKRLRGRIDKKYCGTTCKNRYNSHLRHTNLPVRQRIDRFLHRNHTILLELYHKKEHDKWYETKTKLQKLGFRFNYYTSTYLNKQGKMYYYIYDFRWMEFSDAKVMIVKQKSIS